MAWPDEKIYEISGMGIRHIVNLHGDLAVDRGIYQDTELVLHIDRLGLKFPKENATSIIFIVKIRDDRFGFFLMSTGNH